MIKLIEKIVKHYEEYREIYKTWDHDEMSNAIYSLIDSEYKKIIKRDSEIINVNDRLPTTECGSYLVFAPKSFPKNSRWLVAEYYDDVKGFYSESGEYFMDDVTHWCELPDDPK